MTGTTGHVFVEFGVKNHDDSCEQRYEGSYEGRDNRRYNRRHAYVYGYEDSEQRSITGKAARST